MDILEILIYCFYANLVFLKLSYSICISFGMFVLSTFPILFTIWIPDLKSTLIR